MGLGDAGMGDEPAAMVAGMEGLEVVMKAPKTAVGVLVYGRLLLPLEVLRVWDNGGTYFRKL